MASASIALRVGPHPIAPPRPVLWRFPEQAPARSVEAGDPSTEVVAPGAVLVDRYRIIEMLGRGGMGEVYRAEDTVLGQTVALKILPARVSRDAVWRQRLLDEVRLARRVSRPNVCRVHDVGEADGRLFLSMEYVDGEDLAVLLRRTGRLAGAKALEIARQIAAGLAAAHAAGILHGDLKPADVMLDRAGRVRLSLGRGRAGGDAEAGRSARR
jgi:serine/threonine-protein kinase